MSIKENLETELRDAMRSQDAVRKNTLRVALSAIKLAEIDQGEKLTDSAVIAILQKEIKNRTEAILEAEKAHRPDVVEVNQAEMKILQTFLPAQMNSAELENLVKKVIEQTGASGIKDMGKVMKAVLAEVQDRASGNEISRVVKELLQS